MRAKAMKLSYILPLLIMGGATFFTGCEQGKDLYNPESVQERAKKAFPVKDIDPNHTWETSTLCNATVSVNEKSGDTYTIKVYTENPYNTNGNAALLATTTVADGKTVNFKFDIPAALQQVYVMKVDEAGYSAAVTATVENGVLKVDFGGKNATATRTVMTRSSEGNFFEPETFGKECFPTNAPKECGEVEKYYEKTNSIPYLLNKKIDELKFWAGGVLYIEGSATINDWKGVGDGNTMEIYLLPNSTLNLNLDFSLNANWIFSIGQGATLNMNNKKLAGVKSGAKILNRGIIRAKEIEVTETYLHNEGKISTKKISATKETSYIYNAPSGKITITEKLEIKGGGHFLNDVTGKVIVGNNSDDDNDKDDDDDDDDDDDKDDDDDDDKDDDDDDDDKDDDDDDDDDDDNDDKESNTIIDCSNGSWENRGHFTTDDMKISAWNKSIKNACWMEVKEDLDINSGGIINESYIVCKDLKMDNGTVVMGGGSFFEVTEEAEFKCNKDGFINKKDTYALLKMGEAKAKKRGVGYTITYDGNIYVACDHHFANGYSGQYPIIDLKNNAKMTKSDGADIIIPNSKCNPGYGGTPDGGGNNDKVINYTYGFEDMTNGGDYDFNDVVLCVSAPHNGQNGKKVIDVTLKAAGASKALSVYLNNVDNPVFDDVHEALGVEEGILVNTGRATGKEVTRSIEVSENFNLTENGNFYICDKRTGRKVYIPKFDENFKPGNSYVPYAIRVASTEWKWPKESISIDKAYLGFTNWAQDATQEPDWYEAPVEENVISND